MKALLLIVCLLLAGCDGIDWTNAVERMQCSPEQWERAVKEAAESNNLASGEKYKSYWLNAAVMRNCEKPKGGA